MLQKKSRIKIFPKEKKKKRVNIVANDIKIFPNMTNKGCLSIEKIILK